MFQYFIPNSNYCDENGQTAFARSSKMRVETWATGISRSNRAVDGHGETTHLFFLGGPYYYVHVMYKTSQSLCSYARSFARYSLASASAQADDVERLRMKRWNSYIYRSSRDGDMHMGVLAYSVKTLLRMNVSKYFLPQ